MRHLHDGAQILGEQGPLGRLTGDLCGVLAVLTLPAHHLPECGNPAQDRPTREGWHRLMRSEMWEDMLIVGLKGENGMARLRRSAVC